MKSLPLLCFILVFWWLLILVLSLSGISKIDPPSSETILIIVFGLVAMLLGGFFAHFFRLVRFVTHTQFLDNLVIKRILIFFCLLSAYPLLNAIIYIVQNGVDNYRVLAFAIDENTGESVVFGSLAIQFILSNFIKPLIYFLLIYVCYNKFFCANNNNFYLTILVLTVFSISTLGRFFIYHICILIFISLVIKVNLYKGVVFLGDVRVFAKYGFFALFFILLISMSREIDGVLESVLDYHVLGLKIFSQYIEDKNSILYNSNVSFTSLGLLERLSVILLNKFGFALSSDVAESEYSLSIFRYVGENKLYNAFGTWFFSLYKDGGLIYCVLYSFFYGFFITYFERLFYRFRDARSFLCMISLFFLSFFSIFTSMIQGPFILLPIISFLLSQPRDISH